MNKLLFIILGYLLSININAQHVIETPTIDIIAYNNDADYYLFQQQADSKYSEIYMDKSYRTNNRTLFEIEKDTDIKTLNDITEKYDHIIYTEELKPYKFQNFKNLLSENNWLLHDKKTDQKNVTLLKPLTEDISSFNNLVYDTRLSVGLGGSFENRKDDDIKKWRIEETEYLSTIILSLGNDKYMTLYLERNSVTGILLPLKKQNLLVFDDYKFMSDSNVSVSNDKYDFNTKERLKYFDPNDFYKLKKDSTRYRLTNNYGDDRLHKAFDTIIIRPYYIVGKTSNTFSIYNPSLEKINIPNLKQVYFYRSGLEILDDKGAFYLDSEGKTIDAFPPLSYVVCGTVSSSEYQITKDNNPKATYSISIEDGHTGTMLFKETLQLRGLPINSEVSFLDNSNEFFWDGNSSYVGDIYIKPDLLKVTHNGKTGIFTYDAKKAKAIKAKPPQEYFITKSGDSIPKPTPIDLNKNSYVKVTKILPLIYDKIEMNTNDGLIYFYKDNKVGIYPRHKTVQFDSIKQVTHSFYKISKNEKTGWLDIQTFKEYY